MNIETLRWNQIEQHCDMGHPYAAPDSRTRAAEVQCDPSAPDRVCLNNQSVRPLRKHDISAW